jgi:hypothetical protein
MNKRLSILFRGYEDMNSKRVLRFYFAADRLNSALDNLIEKLAYDSKDEYVVCDDCAEKIFSVIEEKGELQIFWAFLNDVIEMFSDIDREILRGYAVRRTGISSLDEQTRRDIHRVLVKFGRKVERKIARFAEGVRLVDVYYCLCG